MKGHSVNRVEQLFKTVNLEHLNSEENIEIKKIIAKYNDVFHLKSDKLITTNLFKQKIAINEGVKPSYVKPYRVPHAQLEEIKKQVDNMLKEDIIEEANSEWSSPLLLVPKKTDVNGNKKWRLVID